MYRLVINKCRSPDHWSLYLLQYKHCILVSITVDPKNMALLLINIKSALVLAISQLNASHLRHFSLAAYIYPVWVFRTCFLEQTF